jgi:hypothetical protein
MDSLYGEPHRVNYAPATPLHKGIGSYFAHDVVQVVSIVGRVFFMSGCSLLADVVIPLANPGSTPF